MPEGPEIKRLADAIRSVVGGHEVLEVEIAAQPFKRYEQELLGKRVQAIEPRGKATVFVFEGDYNVFTHLKLYGRWLFVGAGETLDTTRQVKFGVKTEHGGVYLCSAPDVTVLHDEDLDEHPYLASLGPDVLDKSTSVEQLLARIKQPAWRKAALGKLMLDQKFSAGVGNYLRSEILFVSGLRPELKPQQLDDDTLTELLEHWLAIPRRSYDAKGVTTPDSYVADQQAEGATRDDYRFHVYKRAGAPCIVCKDTILETKHGGRRIFICPTCQPEA